MKKIVITSILIGISISLYLFYNYKNNEKTVNVVSSKIYVLQIGAYKNQENVSKVTKMLNSYVVENSDNLYHIYVGITANEKNIEKIKAFYEKNGDNIYVRVKTINDEEFIKKLDAYDYMISSSSSIDTILTINKEVLKLYEELSNENKRVSN